ncbi:hypothetical protein JDV02_010294 [Purpureocillium takamizusanense]|uniref:Uncharacterized protein n=1 Tax=Purpureocillium takamizusanense TaxID=2060973 RepID=A0A9Q8VH49_9HYPO|nr:uncharacterized protein JDV02_010294 [Purpureocillium takamizusanense]UNI24559.1 hypothetical protein JDV02_010294 [Purpureocillium takamizusanense]
MIKNGSTLVRFYLDVDSITHSIAKYSYKPTTLQVAMKTSILSLLALQALTVFSAPVQDLTKDSIVIKAASYYKRSEAHDLAKNSIVIKAAANYKRDEVKDLAKDSIVIKAAANY